MIICNPFYFVIFNIGKHLRQSCFNFHYHTKNFFFWYVIEWIVLCVKYRNTLKAYFNIRFEKEAYLHQHDLDYLKKRKHYNYK